MILRKYLKTSGALLDPIVMCDYQLANEYIQKGGGRFKRAATVRKTESLLTTCLVKINEN